MIFSRPSLRTKIVLLLAALFLFQSVWAAVEAGSATILNGSANGDAHHALMIDGGHDAGPDAENFHQDNCDNCCHCHGSHLSLLATTLQIYPGIVMPPAVSAGGDTSQYPSSIHRPPIA